MSDSTPDVAAAVETLTAFLEAGLAAQFDTMRSMVTQRSLEHFKPDASQTMTRYEIQSSAAEGDKVVAPTKMLMQAGGQEQEMLMPFVIMQEDGQWKIDMAETIERLMGGSMDQVMDAMKGAMEGIGNAMAEGMKQAFDGIGDAMGQAMGGEQSGASDAAQFTSEEQPQNVTDNESPQWVAAYEQFNNEDLPRELGAIGEALGFTPTIDVGWGTFCGDVDAVANLARKGLDPVRAALCLMVGEEGVADALREKLSTIFFRSVPDPSFKTCSFDNGILEVAICLTQPEGAFSFDEIQPVIRQGLDLQRGKATRRLMEVAAPALKEAIERASGLSVDVQIDVGSFAGQDTPDDAIQVMHKLEHEVFRNFAAIIANAGQQLILPGRLRAVRFVHVSYYAQRVIHLEGADLVYRLNLTDDAGRYSDSELAEIIPGVLAGLPDSIENAEPAMEYDSDVKRVRFYRDQIGIRLAERTRALAEKEFAFEIDWLDVACDSYAAEGLPLWGLHRVCGAIGLWCADADRKALLQNELNAIYIKTVSDASNKRIVLEDGRLVMHISFSDGERGCYYECDIVRALRQALAPELKQARQELIEHAAAWEKQLEEDLDVPIRFDIDFAGFFSHPDMSANLFGVHILREHGIDALYYAVNALCKGEYDKHREQRAVDPAIFTDQMQRRIRTLRLVAVADPSNKCVVAGYDGSIEYRLYVHQGYDGYLTIPELKREIPGHVDQLSDQFEAPAPPVDEEQAELERLQREELERDRTSRGSSRGIGEDGGGEPELTDEERAAREIAAAQAEAMQHMRASFAQVIPAWEDAMGMQLGHAVQMEIDWDSLGGDPNLAGVFIQNGLSPLLEAFSAVASDPKYHDRMAEVVERVVINRAADGSRGGLMLGDGALTAAFPCDPGTPSIGKMALTQMLKKLVDSAAEGGGEMKINRT